tara:strand:- start:23047 stop:23475 length:429 start_codon:yes stop_codon:yes gene_type:complete
VELILLIKKTNMSNTILNRLLEYEISKFLIVGLLNTGINYFIFYSLLIGLNLIYYISGAIGFLSGAVTGFIFNRLWTFNSNIPVSTGLIKYLFIQLICLMAHVTTQITVTEIIGVPELLSQFIGILVTTFMNFFLIKNLVFK